MSSYCYVNFGTRGRAGTDGYGEGGRRRTQAQVGRSHRGTSNPIAPRSLATFQMLWKVCFGRTNAKPLVIKYFLSKKEVKMPSLRKKLSSSFQPTRGGGL